MKAAYKIPLYSPKIGHNEAFGQSLRVKQLNQHFKALYHLGIIMTDIRIDFIKGGILVLKVEFDDLFELHFPGFKSVDVFS